MSNCALSIVLVVMLLFAGCSDDSEKALRVERSVESWGATLNTTIAQWQQNRVPRTYVRQILEAADKALAEQEKTLTKVNDVRHDELVQKVSGLRQRAHDLLGAVARGDADAAEAIAEGEPP